MPERTVWAPVLHRYMMSEECTKYKAIVDGALPQDQARFQMYLSWQNFIMIGIITTESCNFRSSSDLPAVRPMFFSQKRTHR